MTGSAVKVSIESSFSPKADVTDIDRTPVVPTQRIQTLDPTLFDHDDTGRSDFTSSQDYKLSLETPTGLDTDSQLTGRMLKYPTCLDPHKYVHFHVAHIDPRIGPMVFQLRSPSCDTFLKMGALT